MAISSDVCRFAELLRRIAGLAALALAGLLAPAPGAAQDLEPRRWTHLPVGSHHLAVAYAGQDAKIYYSPLVGITEGTANSNAWLARYSHAFDWSGKTARLDAIVPYVSGTWQGILLNGEPGSRTIRAGGDPWLRLSVNLLGAPPSRRDEYRDFVAKNPVRTIVGASVAISLPLGAYDPNELINVGRNRYAVRPQIGVLHQNGPWSVELTGSVFLFSDNTDFVESVTLSQDAVWALQWHVTRMFTRNSWLGAGMAYANGGRIELDGNRTSYEVNNVLWNLVGGYRITDRHSVTAAWQHGRTQVDVGADTDSWLLSWAVSWGD